MAAISASPASTEASEQGGPSSWRVAAGSGATLPRLRAPAARRARVAAAAAALLVLTNGPVLLFSKRVLDRTGRWEDNAVWPFLAAAAVCGAALAAWDLLGAREQLRDGPSRVAVAAVCWFTLAALASTFWSVDPAATGWRSSIYVGMALLAWAVARLDAEETAAVLGAVAGVAVVASLILVLLRPDLGLDPNDHWKGVYTNRNSLAPLAAIGVLASVRHMLAPGRLRRAAAAGLVAASLAALVGAGSRTAWTALLVAAAAATLPVAHHWLRRRWSAPRAAAATLSAAGLLAAGGAAVLAVLWDVPTLSQRRTLWGLVWDRIVQRPLGGYGFFTFWDIDELTQHVLLRRGSAHNSLLEVGLGLGLLGTVPFVLVVVAAARNAGLGLWRRPGADTWMWAALVAFLLVENLTESFVLWFSYSWVVLMAASLRPAPPGPPAASGLDGRGPGASTWTLASIGSASSQRLGGALRAVSERLGGALRAVSERLGGALRAVSERLAESPGEATGSPAGAGPRPGLARLRSGWTAVALMSLAVLALWLPDLDLPLGNSDDGRIVAFSGLHARNFWDLGPLESGWGTRVDPFVRPEFDVAPRTDPPIEAVTYAHHPPLKDFMSTASAGLLGDNLPALRIPSFAMGAATLAFMASLLRACGLRWGPALLSIGAMASTGFFYVYGRLGVSFSLLLASAAAVAWLRKTPRPSRWALAGTASLAALTAMQSWISLASLGPLAVWLFAGRFRHAERAAARSEQARPRLRRRLAGGWSPALTALVVGTVIGTALTAAWILNATGLTEITNQVDVRAGNEVTASSQATSSGFGEFLSQQWRFATEELLVPGWLRVLLVPALLAGLIDRRTRVATAITLAAAAAMTFGLQQGAWIHRLWNFPWLAPVTIGLAALLDAVRRLAPARLRAPAGFAAAAAIAVTLLAVAAGGTRDRYISEPARLGEALEQAAPTAEARRAELAWVGPGLPAPRWASYYLDLPVWDLEESRLADMVDSDLLIVRASRAPDFLPADALDDPVASAGDFRIITAASLPR